MLTQLQVNFITTHIKMVRQLQKNRIRPPWRMNVPPEFYLTMCQIVQDVTHAEKLAPVRRFLRVEVFVIVDAASLVPKFRDGMTGPEWWKLSQPTLNAQMAAPVDYEPPELVEKCRVRGRNPAWWDPKRELK